MSKKAVKTDTCRRVSGKKNFTGCLRQVRFNDKNIIYAVKEKLTNYKMAGEVFDNCSINNNNNNNLISFTHEDSQLRVSRNILKRNRTTYVMVMRTFESQGHIMTHKAEGMGSQHHGTLL